MRGNQLPVSAWFPDMFCNFYLMKNREIAKNSTATTAREKISTYLESLEFFDVCLTKFKSNLIFFFFFFGQDAFLAEDRLPQTIGGFTMHPKLVINIYYYYYYIL
jgi:hypothetical protein